MVVVNRSSHISMATLVRRASSVRISADRPFTMYADGDPVATLPVTVRALPRAVRVMVPA